MFTHQGFENPLGERLPGQHAGQGKGVPLVRGQHREIQKTHRRHTSPPAHLIPIVFQVQEGKKNSVFNILPFEQVRLCECINENLQI